MNSDFTMSRRGFLAASTAATITSAMGTAFAAPSKGGNLRLAFEVRDISSPHSLNWTQFSNLTTPVVQTLTRIDENNITRPHLCESWEASSDLKSWTIHLRKNATWRKGRPFVAKDVEWNLLRLLNPATGSASLGGLKPLFLKPVDGGGANKFELWDKSAIEIVDDHTVRLNLQVAHVALPETLSQYTSVMMDPEENGVFGPGANGTGPFELTEVQVQRLAKYRRSDNYWGEPAHLDTFEMIDVGDDPNTAIAALASGQIDYINKLPFNLVPIVKRLPGVTVTSKATASCATLIFDCSQKPWDDSRVRRALRLATNREKLLQVSVQGVGTLGEHHHASPEHPDYAPLAPYQHDAAKAKALLEEAGLSAGFEFDAYVSNGYPYEVAAMQSMAEDFAAIGVRMNVLPVPSAQFAEIWNKRPVVMSDWAHRPLAIQMYALVYRSNVPWNTAKWSNARFDELLARAENIVDAKERSKVVAEMEEILQHDGPMIQGFFNNQITVSSGKVGGAVSHPGGLIFPELLYAIA
jgi:peptide/nickel transport system substrate-binding protein